MMLVLDASVSIAWALDDEQDLGQELLEHLTATDKAIVPAHWILEVTNGLRLAVKRRRLESGDPPQILARIREQPIHVDIEIAVRGWHEIPLLADTFGLTTYDAAYLELAMRLDAPLATLDQDLARAARAARIKLFA